MKKDKIKSDPSTYFTLYQQYKMYGYSPNSEDWMKTVGPILIFFIGIIHFGMFVYKGSNVRVEIMEAFHWYWLNTSLLISVTCMLVKRKSYIEIDKMIRNGVFDYGEDFTEEQLEIREETNKTVVKQFKITSAIFVLGIIPTITKQTVFMRKPDIWNIVYIGWIPFEVNSVFRYTIVTVCQLLIAFNNGTTAFLVSMNFLTTGSHLAAQLKILDIAIRNVFNKKRTNEETLDKLKKCIAHHAEVKRLFFLVQDFSGLVGGILPIVSVGLFCTFLYDITDPNSKVGAFVVILLPEASLILISTMFGQRITNLSQNVWTTLYEIEWHTQSVQVQKHLLMMMIASKESMVIKGFGIFRFCLEGLKDVIQTSYTFYNTLNATR